jgi:hypothetical protein
MAVDAAAAAGGGGGPRGGPDGGVSIIVAGAIAEPISEQVVIGPESQVPLVVGATAGGPAVIQTDVPSSTVTCALSSSRPAVGVDGDDSSDEGGDEEDVAELTGAIVVTRSQTVYIAGLQVRYRAGAASSGELAGTAGAGPLSGGGHGVLVSSTGCVEISNCNLSR